MKVVHVEGGLGNQLACYAVYIAAKYGNPDDDFYLDTYIYDIKEAHSTISMWNGYELKKVFGIEIKDIRSLFSEIEVEEQLEYLRNSEFWKHDWNYAEVFKAMMKEYGYCFQEDIKLNEQTGLIQKVKDKIRSIFRVASQNRFMYYLKKIGYFFYNKNSDDTGKYLLDKHQGNYYYDISLDFMKSSYLNDLLGEKIRSSLCFFEPQDPENKMMLKDVQNCNSVSIHVRRTDFLKFNCDCYKYGYFKKAVFYIKKKVKDPIFYIFSDDLEWCKLNMQVIGLEKSDNVVMVDINHEKNSYKDMQIMANCKHNIATKSTFGWWGSFLNVNSDKITICQAGSYVSTKQF